MKSKLIDKMYCESKVIPLNTLTSMHLFLKTLSFGLSVFRYFCKSHVGNLCSPLSKTFIMGLDEKEGRSNVEFFRTETKIQTF